MILKCNCKHDFQDKVYGLGKRVHNQIVNKINKLIAKFRCTVCKTEREK